jgi:hypothetical protein
MTVAKPVEELVCFEAFVLEVHVIGASLLNCHPRCIVGSPFEDLRGSHQADLFTVVPSDSKTFLVALSMQCPWRFPPIFMARSHSDVEGPETWADSAMASGNADST